MANVAKINGYDVKDAEARGDIADIQQALSTAQGDITTLQDDVLNTEADLGDITALTTTVKTSAVNAINEVNGKADDNASQIQGIDHNVPRWNNGVFGKDITDYITDGSLWKRLTGTDGFELFEDIYAGDFFQMSRAITCRDSYDGTQGTSWVTIAEIDGLMYQGYTPYITAHHVVMVPGKGISTSEPNHFGRHAMNDSNTTANGYAGSKMHTEIIGPVTSTGSTASGATINEQLYAEFGSHLQTTGELLSVAMDPNAINRFGNAGGASSSWDWQSCQAVLLSEIEVYGSDIWSSSGFDTGTAKKQFAAFKHPLIQNNRLSWYWLKNVASAAYFCLVDDRGYANYDNAGHSNIYVRPRFVLAA